MPAVLSCLECGAAIECAAHRKYCSDTCRYAFRDRRRRTSDWWQADLARRRARYVPKGRPSGPVRTQPMECVVDGCTEEPLAWNKCRRHYRQARYSLGRERAGETNRGRARKFGVEYASFRKADIFERDGWRCGICGKRVRRTLRFPDPMSPTLDHIVPMSQGGGHVPENVQLAHFQCNRIKSDSMAGGVQPLLFGT